jgi:protocatechuate 3,4-dioxygenase beta subunit
MARFIPWALVFLVLVVAATLLWGGLGEAPLAGAEGAGQTAQAERAEPRSADGSRAPSAERDGTDAQMPGAGTEARIEVGTTARTTVRGRIVSALGLSPGGRAVLLPPPDPLEGGVMAMANVGMEIARDDARKDEFEAKIEAWLGRAEPVAETRLAPDGRFTFVDPPVGRWAIDIRHDALRLPAPHGLEIADGDQADVGDLEAVPAASLLIVASDERGVPIPGARVELMEEVDPQAFSDPRALQDLGGLMGRTIPRRVRTDSDGRAVFQGVDDEVASRRLHLLVRAEGFEETRRDVQLRVGQQTMLRVDLRKGAELEVTVLDPDGAPREGARVTLVYPDILVPVPGRRGGDVPKSYRGRAGPAGQVKLGGLPEGHALLRQSTPGYLPVEQVIEVPPTGRLQARLQLDPGHLVTGRVVDEAGAPVEGAIVLDLGGFGESIMGFDLQAVVGLEMMTLGADERGVATAADGTFRLGGYEAPGTEVKLAAVCWPDLEPARGKGVVGGAGIELSMLATTVVGGRAVDAKTGEPCEAFSARLRQRQFMVMERDVARADPAAIEGGRFEIRGAPRRVLELVVEADGYAPSIQRVDTSEGAVDVGDVRLEPPASIEGVVVDVNGAPVAGAAVRVARGGPMDSPFVAGLLGGDEGEATGADGRFVIEGLSGRSARLVVDADGFATMRSRAIRFAAGDVVRDVTLELSRGGVITGRIEDGAGRGHAGWRVQAEHFSGMGHAFSTSDSDGRFRFEALSVGSYKVTAMPPDFGENTGWQPTGGQDFAKFDLGALVTGALDQMVSERVAVRDGEEVDVTLVHEGAGKAAAVTVRGTVSVGGAPLEDGMVAFSRPGSGLPRHIAPVRGGRFEVMAAEPGLWAVQARSGLLGGNLGVPKQIELVGGVDRAIDLSLPGGRIAGVVLDESGQPVSGVVVALERPEQSGSDLTGREQVGEGVDQTGSSVSMPSRPVATRSSPGRGSSVGRPACRPRGAGESTSEPASFGRASSCG